jgi:hypothetical protein
MATANSQRAKALLLLGVDPTALADAPKITHLIARIEGGATTALDALRASDLPEARHFISKYDNPILPSFVRKVLPLEAFSVAAGLSPTRLFGVIAEVIRLQKAQLGAIKAAERHEAIVEVSSQCAMLPDGVTDRMAHLKHMGFTPSPKGSTINIGINATANAAAKSDVSALPAPEDTIRKMVEARQRSAATLTSGQQPALPPAPPVEMAFMPRHTHEVVTVDGDYSTEGDADDVSSD